MAKKSAPKKKHKATVKRVQPKPDPVTEPALRFPIVGIGAAEGGLESLNAILHALPNDTGMAFICVQHLEPKLVAELTEVLRQNSSMPVLEATNGAQVEPNHIYVVPRDTSIGLSHSKLRLGPRNIIAGELTSIDTLFRSLAQDLGPRAVGVLLSGNASDGPLGLKAIKAAGGITLVQDPKTARFDSMPRSAITSGCVDFIRAPKRSLTNWSSSATSSRSMGEMKQSPPHSLARLKSSAALSRLYAPTPALTSPITSRLR
jgi:two-component system CheB/CheR fusion protein